MIPMLDILALHAPIQQELEDAAVNVLRRGAFINGAEVQQFEESLSQYTGAAHAIAVSSGTDALLVTLMALDVRPGDKVITTAYSFFATAGAIARLGAVPVFADIDKDTFNIDETKIEALIDARTVGILPVHLFGHPASMISICDIAQRHGLWVVEDAAQALGAAIETDHVGTLGTAGIYSFFPAKNLGALGDGGAVVTQNEPLANRIRQLRAHGAKPKYIHPIVGGNFRMDTLQAALLQIKISHLDKWNQKRRLAALYYDALFAPHPQITTPKHSLGHGFNQYVIRFTNNANDVNDAFSKSMRDKAMCRLQAAGISCAVYYPLPLPLQPCFGDLGYSRCHFVQSEAAAQNSLAIPINPTITENEQERVVNSLHQVILES